MHVQNNVKNIQMSVIKLKDLSSSHQIFWMFHNELSKRVKDWNSIKRISVMNGSVIPLRKGFQRTKQYCNKFKSVGAIHVLSFIELTIFYPSYSPTFVRSSHTSHPSSRQWTSDKNNQRPRARTGSRRK